MIIVLAKIRRRFLGIHLIWMTQGKDILMRLLFLMVKDIRGEMIGLLE
jgi:hypothetical protein